MFLKVAFFVEKQGENSNTVKYYYNLKYRFSISAMEMWIFSITSPVLKG